MTLCQGPLTMLSSSSPVSAKAEKKAGAQMKFTLRGDRGRGVKEVLKGSLHSLDTCLTLLLSDLAGQSNMDKPALAIHERGVNEGFH